MVALNAKDFGKVPLVRGELKEGVPSFYTEIGLINILKPYLIM